MKGAVIKSVNVLCTVAGKITETFVVI